MYHLSFSIAAHDDDQAACVLTLFILHGCVPHRSPNSTEQEHSKKKRLEPKLHLPLYGFLKTANSKSLRKTVWLRQGHSNNSPNWPPSLKKMWMLWTRASIFLFTLFSSQISASQSELSRHPISSGGLTPFMIWEQPQNCNSFPATPTCSLLLKKKFTVQQHYPLVPSKKGNQV